LVRETDVRGAWQSLDVDARQKALLEARARLVNDQLAFQLKADNTEEERATLVANIVEELKTVDERTVPLDFLALLESLQAGTENARLPPATRIRRGASAEETAAAQNGQLIHALRSALLSRFMLLLIAAATGQDLE